MSDLFGRCQESFPIGCATLIHRRDYYLLVCFTPRDLFVALARVLTGCVAKGCAEEASVLVGLQS
jgi:hypothetical protein